MPPAECGLTYKVVSSLVAVFHSLTHPLPRSSAYKLMTLHYSSPATRHMLKNSKVFVLLTLWPSRDWATFIKSSINPRVVGGRLWKVLCERNLCFTRIVNFSIWHRKAEFHNLSQSQFFRRWPRNILHGGKSVFWHMWIDKYMFTHIHEVELRNKKLHQVWLRKTKDWQVEKCVCPTVRFLDGCCNVGNLSLEIRRGSVSRNSLRRTE